MDVISDVNLCYSEFARKYLADTGLPKERTYQTGSPMAEVLHMNLEKIQKSDVLERMGLEPDIAHYEVVYMAPLLPYKDQNTMLEELYAKFNVSRPDDFTGHSLSVSDIVALRQNGVVSCHYVDSIGFQELPGFLKPENYQKAAEMAMEDDYGMIDGVINNGKKEEPVEKASVLDQLKEKQEAVPPAPPRRCCEEKEL